MQIIRGKEHFHGGFEGPLVFLIFFLIRRMGVFSLKVSTTSQCIYDGSSEVFRGMSKRERERWCSVKKNQSGLTNCSSMPFTYKSPFALLHFVLLTDFYSHLFSLSFAFSLRSSFKVLFISVFPSRTPFSLTPCLGFPSFRFQIQTQHIYIFFFRDRFFNNFFLVFLLLFPSE
jgi:hypothetical protein